MLKLATLLRNDSVCRFTGLRVRIRLSLLLIAVALVVGNASAARAALVWGGGTDAWNNVSPNFTGAAWVDGGDALFDGGAPTTVKVDSSAGAVNAGSITFAAPGYTIAGNTGSDELTLVGAATIDVASDVALTVALDGAAGLKKLAAGNLTLGAVNSYSGATDIAAGTLTLAGAGKLAGGSMTLRSGATLAVDNTMTQVNDRLGGATSSLTTYGGTLKYLPGAEASSAYTESIGALTLAGGTTKIETAQAAVGNTATLIIGAVTRAPGGGTALFAGPGLGAGDNRNQVALAGVTATNNVVPWAVVTTDNGATYNLANVVAGQLVPLTSYQTSTDATTDWNGLTVNARPAGAVMLLGNATLNSLTLDAGVNINGPGGDRTINFGGGAATILQTGGDSIVYFGGTNTNEYIFSFGGTEGVFHVMGNLTIMRGNTNTFSGTAGITKAGSGTLILGNPAGTNGFASNNSGPFTINEGVVRVNSNGTSALGSGTLVLNGGKLEIADTATRSFNRPTFVNQDATITADKISSGAGVAYTLGALTIGSQTLTIAGGNNVTSGTGGGVTFTGTTLTADPTFNVTNPVVGGTTALKLGTVSDGLVPRKIFKIGNGTLSLATAAGTLADGTQFVVNGGTVSADIAGALGNEATLTTPRVKVNAGGTLKATIANALASSATGNPSLPVELVGGTLQTAKNAATDFRGEIIVTANSALLVDRASSGATLVHTLGTLRIGDQQLDATSANFTAAPTVAFNTMALTGNPTFNPNGTNAPIINLGTLDDGGTARTITAKGTGVVALSAVPKSYVGGYTADGGRLRVSATNQLGLISDSQTISLINGGALLSGATMTLGHTKSIVLGAGGGQIDTTSGNLTLLTPDQLSGSTGLTKIGSNTLNLSAANSGLSVPIAISAGTLSGNVANAFGSGAITLTGGTLRNGGIGSLAFSNPVTVSDVSTTSRIAVGDNFTGAWGGADAVKSFGTLTINSSKVTFDVAATTYNGGSSGRGTLVFSNTVLGTDTEINAPAASSAHPRANANLGLVTGDRSLSLTGSNDWTFIMDQTNQFNGTTGVSTSAPILDVRVANAQLAKLTVAYGGTLRLSANQDTAAGATVPVNPIVGTLDINTNFGAGFPLVMDGGSIITSTSALATTPAPVTFGSGLTLRGTTTVATGGITLAGNLANEINYTGSLAMTGKGILVLSGNNSGLGTNGVNAITVGTTTNGGVVQFASDSARPLGLVMAAENGAVSFAYNGPTAVPASMTGNGAFAVDAANTQPLDFTGTILRLSSAVAGSVSGAITPNGIYRLGGAGGTLTVNSALNDFAGPVGLDMGTAGTLPAGRVILAAANGYTGTTQINAGTLQLAHASAAAGTSGINVEGSITYASSGISVVISELLLDPALTYPAATLAAVHRNGGVVGWTTPKTLATAADVPGIYYGTRVLGLGGEYSADIKINFPITDDSGSPVKLRKTGPAVLDLTGSGTGTYTDGTEIIGGEIKVTDGRELGTGPISFGYGKQGVIHFTASGSLANSLRIGSGVWQGNGGFSVDAGKTVTLTGDLAEVTDVGNPRGSITKLGAGTLQLFPITTPGVLNRWGLDIAEGTLETNQMPDSGSETAVNANGQINFRGGTLRFVAGGITPATLSRSAGIGALWVNEGTSSTVEVGEGLVFKTVGHNGNQIYGELIKTGLGVYQMGTWNSTAQYPRGNGRFNLRQGLLIAGGGLSTHATNGTSLHSIAALSDFPDFTLKIQDGTELDFTGPVSTINGNLSINNEYAGSGTPVAKVAGYKHDQKILPYGMDTTVGALGLQTGGTGATNWTGTLEVLFGTANLNRDAGAPVALSATVPAVLKIDAGATVNVGGTGDILTDSTTPTRHVTVQNDGLFNIAYNNGPTGNVKTAAAVVGAGDLTIASATTLITEVVRQDVLTIQDGGQLKIESAGGPAGTSVVNFLSIANASGSFSWGDGAGAAPAGAGGAGGASVTPVPEPATWLLMLAAAAGFLTWRRRR